MQSRILLVEDTEDLGENIKDILNIEGYAVSWERDGLSGFEACLQSTPDLIISDVVMPGLDGLELIRKIRDIKVYRNLPIIILSARATPEDQQRGMEAGATVYLRKPCKSTELIDTIEQLLHQKNTHL
jgi:DNA-binding response OmpR family regulator